MAFLRHLLGFLFEFIWLFFCDVIVPMSLLFLVWEVILNLLIEDREQQLLALASVSNTLTNYLF